MELDPHNEMTLGAKAQLLQGRHRFAEAVACHDLLIALTEGNDPDIVLQKAWSLYAAGDPEDARKTVLGGLRGHASHIGLLELLARLDVYLSESDELGEAIEGLERCLMLQARGGVPVHPAEDNVGNSYGYALLRSGRANDAAAFWRGRKTVNTSNTAAMGLALSLAELGDTNGAESLLGAHESKIDCPSVFGCFRMVGALANETRRAELLAPLVGGPSSPVDLLHDIARRDRRPYHSLDPSECPHVVDDQIACAALSVLACGLLSRGDEATERAAALYRDLTEGDRGFVPLQIGLRPLFDVARRIEPTARLLFA